MLQVTYISTVARNMSDSLVDDILSVSRRNNAAVGVTGLLLFDGRRFLQALEGESMLVQRTYERIRSDARHKAIVLLSSSEVETRAFGQWASAAELLASRGSKNIENMVEAMTEQVSDPTIRATFRSFVKVRAAA